MIALKSVLIGFVCIAVGCFFIWNTYKHPVKTDNTEANMKGYIGGVILIVVGIMTLIGWGHW